ncbi:MAG: hypothetical protein AUJ20_10470 [Comamonadaceae bacterium CG1_02_60_18]|nr:MAG: hypothetical protein AUJ20_10470 [Comamonadaceae bacterium CG1_02_60_18]PIQ50546.1 MAG: hypothetical protein COW02_19810 [Comamonadaceae bacterium CG12_big_fil_rev_8_21_14_0_65_59_15]
MALKMVITGSVRISWATMVAFFMCILFQVMNQKPGNNGIDFGDVHQFVHGDVGVIGIFSMQTERDTAIF